MLVALASPALADQSVPVQAVHSAKSGAAAVAVLSMHCNWDQSHFVSISGELENVSSSQLSGAQPQVVVRDQYGQRIASADGYADVSSLAPKQRSHFSVAARLADKDDTPVKCDLDFLDSNSSPLVWRDEALGGG
jgi:hypothetical protein